MRPFHQWEADQIKDLREMDTEEMETALPRIDVTEIFYESFIDENGTLDVSHKSSWEFIDSGYCPTPDQWDGMLKRDKNDHNH